MSYYKILAGGKVLDVNSVFLRWQARHGVMLACDAADAQFICPRDGSAVWHPAWLNPAPAGAAYDGDVEAVEIDAEEYAALLAQLDTGSVVENPGENVEDAAGDAAGDAVEDSGGSSPAAPSAVDIKALLEEQKALKEQVRMLTECVLEMSEEVYV